MVFFMSDNSNELITFLDALEAAFPASEMSELARSAATYDFTQHVRQEELSLGEATAVLCDEKKVEGFREVGLKVETYITANGQTPKADKKPSSEALAEAMINDINTVKLMVDRVATVGEKTNEVFAQIEKKMQETGADAADYKRLLHEIRGVTGELKHGIINAIGSTKDIMPQLETLSSHLNDRLQKLDKGVDEVRDNTHPDKTHKENLKMTTHSVIWSAVAGTILSLGATAILSYNAGQKSVQPKEGSAAEQQAQPQKVLLRDVATGAVWEFQSVPVDAKQPETAKPKTEPETPAPKETPKTIVPAGSTPR